MARMMVMMVSCWVVACMLVATEAITCGDVMTSITPCLPYLKSTGGPVPPPCCAGVTKLNGAAKSTPDRQTACGCLKAAAAANPGINYGLAAGLPGKCGLNIPYKISPTTDCTKVQ